MASSSVNENERNADTTAYAMSYSPFRFDSTTTIKSIHTSKSSGAWHSISKNELSDLELLILSIVYELQYCTAAQVRDFLLLGGCANKFKRFSAGDGNPYRNPIHALIRKGLLIPLSIFRDGKACGPSILQLSSFSSKLMELLLPNPRIFDHFPSRIANDPPLILAVLVRNSACINILKSNPHIFLTQAIENAPSIPHICLKTRFQGQILVFPFRSNKKALKAELDRQNVASFQAYIVIAETLDDARKLNLFLDSSHFKIPLFFSTDASLKNPEIPLLKHLYQFTDGHMECLALSDT